MVNNFKIDAEMSYIDAEMTFKNSHFSVTKIIVGD
jgi:hypothetical protein